MRWCVGAIMIVSDYCLWPFELVSDPQGALLVEPTHAAPRVDKNGVPFSSAPAD